MSAAGRSPRRADGPWTPGPAVNDQDNERIALAWPPAVTYAPCEECGRSAPFRLCDECFEMACRGPSAWGLRLLRWAVR